jgi:hypothetical protein
VCSPLWLARSSGRNRRNRCKISHPVALKKRAERAIGREFTRVTRTLLEAGSSLVQDLLRSVQRRMRL